MPAEDRTLRFYRSIVVPATDLVCRFRQDLGGMTLSEAAFEELVRQCLDIYLDSPMDADWHQEIAQLPDLNRIEISELNGPRAEIIYDAIAAAVEAFACTLFDRLKAAGVFLNNDTRHPLSYAFDRFLGHDIVLFHVPY